MSAACCRPPCPTTHHHARPPAPCSAHTHTRTHTHTPRNRSTTDTHIHTRARAATNTQHALRRYYKGRYGGFAGEVSALQVADLLTDDDNVFLVDVRTEQQREADGVPELKLAARYKVAAFPLQVCVFVVCVFVVCVCVCVCGGCMLVSGACARLATTPPRHTNTHTHTRTWTHRVVCCIASRRAGRPAAAHRARGV
jgi:hypothetical protein